MTVLEAAKYISDGDMSSVSNIFGPILDCAKIDQLSFGGSWTGTPTGELRLYGSNDPRAAQDQARGTAGAAYTANWVQMNLPATASHGSGFTAAAAALAIAGAAGNFALNVANPMGYMQLRYVRTSGGSATSLQVRRQGRSAK